MSIEEKILSNQKQILESIKKEFKSNLEKGIELAEKTYIPIIVNEKSNEGIKYKLVTVMEYLQLKGIQTWEEL